MTDPGRCAESGTADALGVLAALGAATDDIVFAKNLDGRYSHGNAALGRLFRKPLREIIGRDDSALLPPDAARRVRQDDLAVLSSGRTRKYEETLDTPQGPRTFSTTKGVIRDGRSQVVGIFGMARDVTDRVRADQALLESEARVAKLFHGSPIPAAIERLSDARILDTNQAFLRSAGMSREEVVGRTSFELGIWDSRERNRLLESIPESGPSHAVEIVGRTPRGEPREMIGYLELVEIGAEPCLRYSTIDVTERSKVGHERDRLFELERAARTTLEASDRKMRELLEITEAALASLDLDDLLKDLLDRLRRVFGADTACVLLYIQESNELVVRATVGLDESIGLRFPATRGLEWRAWTETRPIIVDDLSKEELASPILRNHGIQSVIAAPLRTKDQSLGVIHVGTMQTRRFTDDDATFLQLIADRVAAAVDHARLYEAERAAHQRAEQATHAREDLLAVVSHDLRNPITAITLSASMLHGAAPCGESGSFAREVAKRIDRNARRMEYLIRDLLDASAIEAGRFPVDRRTNTLDALVGEAYELMLPMALERRIRLERQLPAVSPPLDCDRDRVLQVFSNLIGNALKFTPEGGSITISAAIDGKWVSFGVKDTGPGVPPEALPHLFDRYWQARRAGRAGAGLGLYIVKGIVEAHGGGAWAESDPPHGSTFHFRLPVCESHNDGSSADDAQQSATSPASVSHFARRPSEQPSSARRWTR